ncbi:lipocalin family protein [Siphonobacter sp.]|uniref:lipocalin family protein n=1 Tax=Siphonobacter sp. TaxID=1869184 RepID=UPI003B3ACEFE
MRKISLGLVLLSSLSCSKKDLPSTSLVGHWQLVSYCKPTTDSTCTPLVIPSDKQVLVTFKKNGDFEETYANTLPIHYAFLGCGNGKYSLEDTSVRIRALCMSSTQGRLFQQVQLDENRLILTPDGTGEYMFKRLGR